jgi:hypothetical protein
MLDKGRQADLEYIAKRMPHAVGSEKQALERAVYDILNENGYTRSMRETLINEMRQGRTENVKDINEEIYKMKERRNWRVT